MASAKVGRGSDQFPLRLPDGLRDRIKRHADANGRSMNSELVQLIETGLFEADMTRMEQGLEPLREVRDVDLPVIEAGKRRTAAIEERKHKDDTGVEAPSYDVPFFDDPLEISATPLTPELFDKLFGEMRDRLDRIERKVDDTIEANK